MRIKLDENLPASLASVLIRYGHDVDTVIDENLEGQDDAAVWKAAQRERRFFITQDLDFSDTRRFASGTHHGLLLLRLTRPGRLALAARLETPFAHEPVNEWQGRFVVASDLKLRVLRP